MSRVRASADLGGIRIWAGPVSDSETDPAQIAVWNGVTCWKEYDFFRSGNTLYATGYKDCVNLDVAQKLPVAIQMWYSDEYGNTGWMNVSSGSGTVTVACKSYWPAWYRHSVTKQQIYC